MSAEEIAARLTGRDANVILSGGIAYGNCPFNASVVRHLIRRGIFSREDTRGHRPTYRLTPLGLQVRALIEGTTHD